MLIRPPSNQKTYDAFYWRDPAFKQPPDDPEDGASLEAIAEHRKAALEHHDLVKRARETGDWSALLLDGKQPTKFVMRPINGTTARRLADKAIFRMIGPAELNALSFRCAIEAIENPSIKVTRAEHDYLGQIATEDVITELDAIEPAIVTDLGSLAYERARSPSPK